MPLLLLCCRCAAVASPFLLRRCCCAVFDAPLLLRCCRCAVVTASLSLRQRTADSAAKSTDSSCDESECSSGSRSRKKARSFLEISSFDWLATFFRCDTIVHDLERLENTPNLQLDDVFFRHYLQILQRLRNGQGCMYQAGE